MNRIILILTFLIFYGSASAQSLVETDSIPLSGLAVDSLGFMEDFVTNALEEKLAVSYLNALSADSITNNPDIAMRFAIEALTMSTRLEDKRGMSNSMNNLATIELNKDNYWKALGLFKHALKMAEAADNKVGMAASYNSIGVIFSRVGNFPEALRHFLKALKLNEESGNKKWQALNLEGIGHIYHAQENWDDALTSFSRSLELYRDLNNKLGVANNLESIGSIMSKQGKYADAIRNNFNALQIRDELGDTRGLAASYMKVGSIHHLQKNFTEALKYYKAAFDIVEKEGDKSELSKVCASIGGIYIDLQDFKNAELYLNKALAISKEIHYIETIRESYLGLAKLDSARGNYLQAFEYYKSYIHFRDSLVNDANSQLITEQRLQYEFDKRESLNLAAQDNKVALAQSEVQRLKLIQYAFIGGFTIVLLFSFIFLRQRNKIRKGKVLSDELLWNILPEEVAEELKTNGSAEARLMDDVTVMFTDFVGFTELSERLSPKELVEEINECYSAFDQIMEVHGVEKIKTIGDAYMAAGGVPVANQTNASDVVMAALEIQQFMKDHKLKKEAAGMLYFEVRIGIHTGPVVAGIVGLKKFAYDIWGDTVNTAHRMEDSGETGKINISEVTYRRVKDAFVCTYRGKIEAKGKGEMDMYFVEGSL